MTQTMEARVARLEGINEQIRDRLNSIDARFDSLAARMEVRFAAVDARFSSMDAQFIAIDKKIDSRFLWTLGVILSTWMTTLLTILFHR